MSALAPLKMRHLASTLYIYITISREVLSLFQSAKSFPEP